MDATVIGRFEVRSFDTWRTAFERHAEARRGAGLKGATIYRDQSSPNLIFLVLEWSTEEGARAWVEDVQHKARMMTAGVVGIPEFRFVRQA